MNILIGTPILRNLIGNLTRLFSLSEAERLQAGIFLGEEEIMSDMEHGLFPPLTVEESRLRVAQDG